MTSTTLMELQRFETLVQSITDYAIYMLDLDGNIASWNSGAQRFKGYTASEIIGKHFSCFFTPADQANGLPALALKTAAAEGRFENEGWRVRKDGSQFLVNAVIDAIRAEDGRLLGFAKITRDITERKTREEALRRSEEQFRLLVQGVTDYAIYMLDPEGRVTNWNAGAQRIKGYAESDVLGSHFSRFYTPADQASGLPSRALQIAKSEGRFEQEGVRIRKDGSQFMAHVVIDPLYDNRGQFIGFAKITRDITEKQNAAEALRRTEQALQQAQKMEAIGKLTGGIAHDFNNLLQIISGNLQLLLIELDGDVRSEERLRSALSGVQRGAKLANYLLAFGRRQALDPKVVNIGRFVAGMEDMLQRALGESIEIETVIFGSLWNTFVDISQVENAVLNLAINARDAMDGSGKLTIEIGNAFLDDLYARSHPEVTAGQYVVIAVTDTGCGMTPEVVSQAFEPFFSTKAEGKGTGLGLSMVYGFARQTGGHLKIYSEPDSGTTVKLYLPRSTKTEDMDTAAAAQHAVGGSETILVAEDDEELCKIVVDMLRDLGYQVLKANDATAALAIIESGIRIDLLFTDVVMPGPLRSPDLARKGVERQPDMAVLFTSGYTQNAIVHGGRLDPGVQLLGKPYSREALARKIRDVLANRKQRDALETPLSSLTTHARKPLLDQPRLAILLVEDDAPIRANTAELLIMLGHSVLQAANAHEGLQALDTAAIDILITDIELPDMDGELLAQKIRDRVPAIGVIFATGQRGPKNSENAVVLSKPYGITALSSALNAVNLGARQKT